MAAADRHDELAVIIEGGVQRAIGVQANQAEIIVGAIPRVTRHQDLAVGLHADAVAEIVAAADRHDELAVVIKGKIQRPVDIQTDQAEVRVGAIDGKARHQDLAVGLQAEAIADVVAAADRHDELAVAIKGGIKRPIRIQTDQAEVIVDAIEGLPRDQDLAVRLHGDAVADVVAAADRHDELAVAIEGSVQRPVCVQANQAEIITAAIVGVARHQDLAVGLHGEALTVVVAAADRHHQLAAAGHRRKGRGVVDCGDGQARGVAGRTERAGACAGSGDNGVVAGRATRHVPGAKGDRGAQRAVQITEGQHADMSGRAEQQREFVGGAVDLFGVDGQPVGATIGAVLPGAKADVECGNRDGFDYDTIGIGDLSAGPVNQQRHHHACGVAGPFKHASKRRAERGVEHWRLVARIDGDVDGGRALRGECAAAALGRAVAVAEGPDDLHACRGRAARIGIGQ